MVASFIDSAHSRRIQELNKIYLVACSRRGIPAHSSVDAGGNPDVCERTKKGLRQRSRSRKFERAVESATNHVSTIERVSSTFQEK